MCAVENFFRKLSQENAKNQQELGETDNAETIFSLVILVCFFLFDTFIHHNIKGNVPEWTFIKTLDNIYELQTCFLVFLLIHHALVLIMFVVSTL